MTDTPSNARIRRAYNLGLKIAANVEMALSDTEVEHYENHLDEIPSALKRGFSVPEPEPILRLISESENLVIDPTDGAETLAKADVFFAYVDPDFVNWDLDEASRPTEKTPVEVYEMVRDANFDTMFCSISNNLDDLCFTQSQIKGFCVKHKSWLRTDGYGTFFLFKSNGKFFVASVYFVDRERPGVSVLRLENDDVCYADRRHRVVLPQL